MSFSPEVNPAAVYIHIHILDHSIKNKCTVCSDPERLEIEERLLCLQSKSAEARKNDLGLRVFVGGIRTEPKAGLRDINLSTSNILGVCAHAP